VPGRGFTLTGREVVGTAEEASVTHPEYLREVRAGDRIWMDDGMIQLAVEETNGTDVHCRVVVGGRISDHKGISLPRVQLPAS
jgi:pyruvate kinase